MTAAEKLALSLAAFYLIGVVVCFGPATVESERAEAAHDATCDPQPSCRWSGPNKTEGLPKALFWPLWLSYEVAK